MTILTCRGLDGANPLHVLAALGLLRLADRAEPGARLGFALVNTAWRPVLEVGMEREALLTEIAAWLVVLARKGSEDPSLQKQVRELGCLAKKKVEAVKSAAKEAKAEAKRLKHSKVETRGYIQQATAVLDLELAEVALDLGAARKALSLANGLGIAHLGEIIGVNPEIFRQFGEAALEALLSGSLSDDPTTADPILVTGHLPALACDQVVDGDKVKPTPYSFGNGASGQCLLKSFLACAGQVTLERLAATLDGGEVRLVEGRGLTLNWDPEDLRSYALAWDNPESVAKSVDVGANALAYVGLGLLPAVPGPKGLDAVGWGPEDGWTWPVWEPRLPMPVVASLLADRALQAARPDVGSLERRGVCEVRRSARVNPTGKRSYFASSRPC